MRTRHLIMLPALGIALSTVQAAAESWPTKPLRAVVPVGAGSTVDIVPRVVFEQLSRQLGQNIVVENRPGAGTTIGSSLVARANADGYTFLVNSSAHTITPALYHHLNYQPARDLVPVVPLGISPQVLVVSQAKGFKTVGDLIAAAKAKPGGFNFSSVGVGTATHMAAERFNFSAKISAVHVPYKGGAEAMSEAMAGRVEFFFGPVGLVLPYIRDGRLVALVANGSRRAAALPDAPTMREAGLTDAEYPFWFGMFLPSTTPRDIIDALNRETLTALRVPRIRDKLATLGVDPIAMTAKEFGDFVQQQFAIDAALVRAINLKLD